MLANGPVGIRLKQTYQVFEGKIEAGDLMEALEGGFFAAKRGKRGTTYH